MIALSLWKGNVDVPDPKPVGPTMREIVVQVAERRGLTPFDILGKSRLHRDASARHEAMWELKRQTSKSFSAIARFFNCDHTTVIAGCRTHEARVAVCPQAIQKPVGAGCITAPLTVDEW